MDVFVKRLNHIAHQLDTLVGQKQARDNETDARLARIEHLLHWIARAQMNLENEEMATKAVDQALIAEVHRNTDVSKAATAALTKLQGDVVDLTTKLATAIAGSDASDDPDVQAALAELKANNDAQAAATPAVAAAIANTDPAAPVPTEPTA